MPACETRLELNFSALSSKELLPTHSEESKDSVRRSAAGRMVTRRFAFRPTGPHAATLTGTLHCRLRNQMSDPASSAVPERQRLVLSAF